MLHKGKCRYKFAYKSIYSRHVGWKGYLAKKLRILAQKLDRQATILLTIDSTPQLSVHELHDVIKDGMKRMEESHQALVKNKALDNLFDAVIQDAIADNVK
jgi:hypothetical protein